MSRSPLTRTSIYIRNTQLLEIRRRAKEFDLRQSELIRRLLALGLIGFSPTSNV